ncbi:hypothetical protein [Streptomyces violaceusniger]|uniref:Uncharacterized protein n=1 Tax=Streptomyces violaceusniger TaxID=68280 RepID=A0A4D4KV12_STRVO|nr:hypothetical protein SVIO_008310 [Streptomyces violaceusniger]
MAADAQWTLREHLKGTRECARELRRTARLLIEESRRLQDENYQLRHEHACIVEASRTLMQWRQGPPDR